MHENIKEPSSGLYFKPEIWRKVFFRSPEVQWKVLDTEAILLNLENGAYYTLNRVGSVIWEQITGERPVEEILAAIRERFDIPEKDAREDIVSLVKKLHQEGLILEQSKQPE